MKKFVSILLTVMMIFGVVSATFVGASAADPTAYKVNATSYEIKVNSAATENQAEIFAMNKLSKAAEGIEEVSVIFAVGEGLLTGEPTWKYVTAYKNRNAEIKTKPGEIYQSMIGYIISEISAGKVEFYVYGSTSNINPLLFKAVKVSDVSKMVVTKDIKTPAMAVAVANGLMKDEIANVGNKPLFAVYAESNGKYSAIQTTSYDETTVWSTSFFSLSADQVAQLASEGRLYVLSKNSAGNLWDRILDFFQKILDWFISLFAA